MSLWAAILWGKLLRQLENLPQGLGKRKSLEKIALVSAIRKDPRWSRQEDVRESTTWQESFYGLDVNKEFLSKLNLYYFQKEDYKTSGWKHNIMYTCLRNKTNLKPKYFQWNYLNFKRFTNIITSTNTKN